MYKRFIDGSNNELTSAILSCMGDGVITTDLNGGITYMNHIAEEIIGLQLEEALNRDFGEVFPFFNEETKLLIENPVQKVLQMDISMGLENNTVILSKDNLLKYVSATCSQIKSIEGVVFGTVVILRDITRIKLLEIEHINEENNLKAIFNYAPVGMVTLNEETVIVEVNKAALQIIGSEPEAVMGNYFGNSFHCSSSFSDMRGCGYGPDCPNCELRRAAEAAIRQGIPTRDIEFKKNFNIKGTMTEFWFRTSVTPIMIKDSKYAVLTLMDITERKKRELMLTRSVDYCHNILDQIPSLVWKSDPEMQCNYVNCSWTSFTGLSLEEASPKGWLDIVHPEDLINIKQTITEAVQNRLPFNVENRIRRYDGVYRWSIIVGTPYYDLEEQFAGYIGITHDITDRKETEGALSRYQMLFENARDIMLFIDLDGQILEANKAAVLAYGYSYKELCSLNIRTIRDDWGYTKKQMKQAEAKGISFQVSHRRKDGSVFPVEVSSQGADIEGKRILLSVVRDITERKKAETKLYESQMKYRTLFMNMSSGYAYFKVIYNQIRNPIDLKFYELNDTFETYFGVTGTNIIGRYLSDFSGETSDFILNQIIDNLIKLNNGDSLLIDEYYINSLNKWFTASVYSPKAGDIVLIITDISHLKQSEIKLITAKEAAEAANRAKSEFLANMSHEIRTPLNGIVGMVDLTMLTDLNDEQKDNLVTAKSCADSLLKIINDILDFSKMEAGKVSIEYIDFEVKSLVEEIIRTHSPRVAANGLDLNYSYSSSIPQYLTGDPNRLRQIINNLISNAIKFTEKGEISLAIRTLSIQDGEAELQFSVTDTGIGIGYEDIQNLFQSFRQIENPYTKKYGGTGLGLAISKQLVEMMGGIIDIESEKGKGSKFYFNLKFKIGNQVKQQDKVIPHILKARKALELLLVEDDPINQKVISKMLKEKGHKVAMAANGAEAVSLFGQSEYDAILMDIQMPVMDGIEATKRIRSMEASDSHIPIIALTAYALQGDRERFLNHGMDGYVAKPIHMDELFYTLEMVSASSMVNDRSIANHITFHNSEGYIPEKKQNGNIDLEMIRKVFDEITECIELLEEALLIDDLMRIEHLAHNIKTLSGDIDEDEIKDMAFKVELAARRGNLADSEKNLRKMKSIFKLIKESKS